MTFRSQLGATLAFVCLATLGTAAFQKPALPGQTTQAPPPAIGAISGTVVDGSTGLPLAEAIVTLQNPGGAPLPAGYQTRQLTDARGRFIFLNLPDAETYQLIAGKFGYLDGGYGRDSAPTDPLRSITISGGSWAGNLRVNIWTPGAISGTVRDEAGEPLVGVLVRTLARFRIAGREELAAGPLALTDDRGEYRLSGLPPGRYVVQVPSVQMTVPSMTGITESTPNAPEGAIDLDETSRLVIGRFPLPPPAANGRPMTYPSVFHPNALTATQATVIDLKFGDDRMAVDVTLTPVPAVRVSGVVEAPPEALTNLTLRLLPAGMENLGLGAEAGTALVGSNGAFTFLNVPVGVYTLDAPLTFNQFSTSSGGGFSGSTVGLRGGASIPPPPPRQGWSSTSTNVDSVPGLSYSSSDFRGVNGGNVPALSGRMPLNVGASDMTGVILRLRPNAIMRGTVVVENDPSKPAPAQPPRFSVLLDPASGQPALGTPRAFLRQAGSSDFEITGVQPAEYHLRIQGPGGWQIKSVLWKGRDYLTTPFDAAATDDFSGVVVTVTNAVPTLSGSVHARDGSTPDTGLVVVFPVQPQLRTNTGLWSTRMTSTVINSGRFRLTWLPAGDY
jgi:hypothetical protein